MLRGEWLASAQTESSRLEGAARHGRRVSRGMLLVPFVTRSPLLSLASLRLWRIHKVRVFDRGSEVDTDRRLLTGGVAR